MKTSPDDPSPRLNGPAGRPGRASATELPASVLPKIRNLGKNEGVVGNAAVVCRSGAETFLYVANYTDGTVDVFNRHCRRVRRLTDPSLPRSYAPFDLQVLDGSLFVTFADRDAFCRDSCMEPEHGVIAQFDPEGVLLERADFRSRGHSGGAWRREMRKRIAVEQVQQKRTRGAMEQGRLAP